MKKAAVTLILIVSFLLTGCWNAREINELGFVLSIGIDKVTNGFKVTAQIANPQTYSKTQSSSINNKSFWIVSSNGKTIFEAIRNMSTISSRRIFWAHIKVIIINEELARSNTLEIFDFFTRNPELRLRTLVAVTPYNAGKLIEVVPDIEKDPATLLEDLIEKKNLSGKVYGIMLKDFLEDYLDPNIGPVTSRIIIDKSKPEPALKVSGAYVFDGNKLVGSLDDDHTRGLLWIKNKIHDSIRVVYCPLDSKPVTLEIKSSKTSFKSYMEDNEPYYIIKVKAKARITEQGCLTDFNDFHNLNLLSRTLEKAIQADIESTITTAKSLRVDFLGLSRILHRQHKEEWHRVSSNWNNVFRKAKVTIIVKVDINHVSLAKPLEQIKMKK